MTPDDIRAKIEAVDTRRGGILATMAATREQYAKWEKELAALDGERRVWEELLRETMEGGDSHEQGQA